MPAKEEHGCDSVSESLDKHEPRDILHCYFERCDQSFAVAVSCEASNDGVHEPRLLSRGLMALLKDWSYYHTVPDVNKAYMSVLTL